jgi:hypothetical protein
MQTQTVRGTPVPPNAVIAKLDALPARKANNTAASFKFTVVNMNARSNGQVASFLLVSEDQPGVVFNAQAAPMLKALQAAQFDAEYPQIAQKFTDVIGTSGSMRALLTHNWVQSAEADGTPMTVATDEGEAYVWGAQYQLTPTHITLDVSEARSVKDLNLISNARSDGVLLLDQRRDINRFGGRGDAGDLKMEIFDL